MGKTESIILSLLILFSSIPAAASGGRELISDPRSLTIEEADRVRQELRPFFEGGAYPSISPREEEFLSHYTGDSLPGSVRMGYFYSREKRLAVYLFLPDQRELRGTVFLLHGYLDHSLSNSLLIRYLLEEGYGVLAFDLPGHGLSQGSPASIEDFAEYASALERLIRLSTEMRQSLLPGPYAALAHSTGCSVLMETLSLYGNIFDRVIMAAPLVQAVGWRITPLGITLAEPFTDDVGRRFGGSSSNPEHGYFVEHLDPLQSRTVPFDWVYAHEAWFERMEKLPAEGGLQPIILQGDEDRVVDYKYNIPFLLDKYPGAEVHWFSGGGHSLFNEIPGIREPVFRKIGALLHESAFIDNPSLKNE